jgi:hypothetical protein
MLGAEIIADEVKKKTTSWDDPEYYLSLSKGWQEKFDREAKERKASQDVREKERQTAWDALSDEEKTHRNVEYVSKKCASNRESSVACSWYCYFCRVTYPQYFEVCAHCMVSNTLLPVGEMPKLAVVK